MADHNISFSAHQEFNHPFKKLPVTKINARDRAFVFNREMGRSLVDAACRTVVDIDKNASAAIVITPEQRMTLTVLVAIFVTALLVAFPAAIVVVVVTCSLFFLLNCLFKLCLIGQRQHPENDCVGAAPHLVAPLPTITILVPLYKEAETLPSITSALGAIDYPQDKLDIKFVFEEDDQASIELAKRIIQNDQIEIIVTPTNTPKTKPKACNYALFQARGDITVIYDAEDIPDPKQLLKAAAAFQKGGEKCACVQARLNYYNSNENWLTRLFSLEYYLWFGFFLPGLQAMKAPIPLGGTSNFIRTDVLRKLGAWDAFNVTEDADLGLRLARAGYHTQVIDSETLEEATCTMHAWIKQRTRWIKGHLQTWLVHLRMEKSPQEEQTLGARMAVHLFLAGNFFSAFLSLPLWLIFGLVYCNALEIAGLTKNGSLNQLSIFVFIFGYGASVFMTLVAGIANRRFDLLPAVFATPVYWLLNSIAAYCAVYELIRKPFYWSKTRHVQSKMAVMRHASLSRVA